MKGRVEMGAIRAGPGLNGDLPPTSYDLGAVGVKNRVGESPVFGEVLGVALQVAEVISAAGTAKSSGTKGSLLARRCYARPLGVRWGGSLAGAILSSQQLGHSRCF